MSSSTLIRNAGIVNEGRIITGDVLIENGTISKISETGIPEKNHRVIEAKGQYLMPGMIDDQVHFREPGLTHKAELATESRAAVAGGITGFMEMPNTVPNTLTRELLEKKYRRASEVSVANYSFFMGASNNNLEEVLKTDPGKVCGVKVFMGSSTGNMLVDNRMALEKIFSECPMLIATHCEDEATIRANMKTYRARYGEEVPIRCHPEIRSAEACYKSSSLAVELAEKYNTRLHVLHISTARETALFDGTTPIKEKRITAEACIHHLWFTDAQYGNKGTLIKWNPAVKSEADREGVWQAVLDNRIDIIATDHAPHTLEEKSETYFNAPSGGPLVQHALVALLEQHLMGRISLERIAEKTAHAVADCFRIKKRGYIREGYFADLILADLNAPQTVSRSNILYKCGWSPFEGQTFRSAITHTFVNGNLVWENGRLHDAVMGQRMQFDR